MFNTTPFSDWHQLVPRVSILDEINKEVSSMSIDEQQMLAKTQEYELAKQQYEAGFMSFLGMKFSNEYVNTPDGKTYAEALLASIRKSKDYVKGQLRAKEERVNLLLDLMEKDPLIRQRLDEAMNHE